MISALAAHRRPPSPDAVPVATTASALTLGGTAVSPLDSPAGARWLPLTPNATNAQVRVRLVRLVDLWPGTRHLAISDPSAAPASRGSAGPPTGNAVPGRVEVTPPPPMPPDRMDYDPSYAARRDNA